MVAPLNPPSNNHDPAERAADARLEQPAEPIEMMANDQNDNGGNVDNNNEELL